MILKDTLVRGITSISPKKITTVAAFLLTALTADAQMRIDADIIVDAGLKNKGNTLIAPGANIAGNGVMHLDSNLINNKGTPDAFTPASNVSVVMTGTAPQTIGGTTATNFPNLTIDNPAGIELLQNQTVEDTLQFDQGLLDLNGQNIDLGATGVLSNESNTSRITDITDGGTVTATRDLNVPTNQEPGNLRLIISSLDNLSSTTISRSHTKKTSPTGESIDLVYTVQPTNLPVTGLTNTIKYFDAELGVAPEAELGQWQKIGGIWQLQNTSVANPVNNTVVANSTGFGDTLTLAGTVTEALPVTRCNPKDFKAKCEEGIMHINWFVYTEINNYGFEIQSNDDPINNPQGRQSVGFINSHESNTSSIQNYEFSYPKSGGLTYYRIKQIDNDGASDYSTIFAGSCESVQTRDIGKIFENPTTDGYVSIIIGDNEVTALPISIIDMNGRLVSHYEKETVDGYSTISLDVSALAAGTYIVQIGEDAKHVSNAIQRLIVLR